MTIPRQHRGWRPGDGERDGGGEDALPSRRANRPVASPTPPIRLRTLAGWGRYPVVEGVERLSEDLREATRDATLTRGLGRSYGDASLPADGSRPVAGSRLADRILSFDATTGVLRAEAGFPLTRMNRLLLPRGWATPVSPGTRFVTLGGMVAADVHGKNHHVRGCFGEHVRALTLRVADGRILDVDDTTERDLFRATLGGMGLTGHVLEVEVALERIPSPWIWQESERVDDLDQLVAVLRRSSGAWPFTVAWADCLARGRKLGRGIVIRGRWADGDRARPEAPAPKRSFRMPFDLPAGLLNAWTVRAFNLAYFRRHPRGVRQRLVHPESFFYPLDAILDWNRLYGRRGFTQYQCVLPETAGSADHRRFFETIRRHRGASFLTVVKDCGPEGRGLLSFPRPGISIALDLPLVPGRTQELVDELNRLVIGVGGRIYLAKDALTRAEDFRAMEPRLERFQALRRRWDPEGRFASAQSRRLLGD